MGNLKDATRTLTAAVADTLDALSLASEDTAATRLARQYAETIDRAETAVDDAQRALEACDPDDIGGRIWLQKLEAKVTAQDVLDKLGPKLLAVLESLGATPLARSKMKGGKPDSAEDPLDALRKRRRRGA